MGSSGIKAEVCNDTGRYVEVFWKVLDNHHDQKEWKRLFDVEENPGGMSNRKLPSGFKTMHKWLPGFQHKVCIHSKPEDTILETCKLAISAQHGKNTKLLVSEILNPDMEIAQR